MSGDLGVHMVIPKWCLKLNSLLIVLSQMGYSLGYGQCFWIKLVVNTKKNGFVTVTKLGITNKFLLLQPKILLQ